MSRLYVLDLLSIICFRGNENEQWKTTYTFEITARIAVVNTTANINKYVIRIKL